MKKNIKKSMKSFSKVSLKKEKQKKVKGGSIRQSAKQKAGID